MSNEKPNIDEQEITQISQGRFRVGITGLKAAIEAVKSLGGSDAEIAQALMGRLRSKNYILRAVSKNGPCSVDAISLMTGARINFQTLRIDNTVGDGFIIQKISTGEAYDVHLKPGVFPKELGGLEGKIRKLRAEGKDVAAAEIDAVKKMEDYFSRKLLNTPPAEAVEIKALPNYHFQAIDLFGTRGDVINKSMPRSK